MSYLEIPVGETLVINPGRYKFVGPTRVKIDPSFNWPEKYISGKVVDYGDAFSNSNTGNDSQVLDSEVPRSIDRRPDQTGVRGATPVRPATGTARQSQEVDPKQGLGSGVRSGFIATAQVEAGPDPTTGKNKKRRLPKSTVGGQTEQLQPSNSAELGES